MTDLVFTTSASVGDDNTIDLSTGVPDVASETADGDGLSLVEAVLIVSPFGGTNTIQASEMLPSVFFGECNFTYWRINAIGLNTQCRGQWKFECSQ